MASTLEKIGVSLKLNNGTTATGATKTVSVSFPTLSIVSGKFNETKVWAVITAVTPCLSKALVRVTKTETSELTNG